MTKRVEQSQIQGRRACAVHIVIAVDDNALTIDHGLAQAVHRVFHAGEQEWIGAGSSFLIQSRPRFIERLSAPSDEHCRCERRDTECVDQCA